LWFIKRLVGEGQATHTALDAQHVVVDREQLLQSCGRLTLQLHRHLSVVNAREVASAGWLVLLGLQGERVGVDTAVGGTGVVVERLHLVKVLAGLLLEAILTVQDHLEQIQGTHLDAHSRAAVGCRALLNPEAVAKRCIVQLRTKVLVGQCHSAAGVQGYQVGHCCNVWHNKVVRAHIGSHVTRDVHVGRAGGEVPHAVQVGTVALGASRGASRNVGVLVAPHQLLHGVVEGQADQLGGTLRALGSSQGVTAGVLHLLNQVLVTLLGEAATLLRVQVDVVGPHLESVGGAEVVGVVGGQVKVQAHLVVLQGNQGQVQAWVAVEEEQQRQVHTSRQRGGGNVGVGQGGHLAPRVLVRLVQEQLGVQAPPGLVVLVDALAANGQLDRGDGTLGNPVSVVHGVVGGQVGGDGGQRHVHVANQVTVAGNRHGHTAVGSRGTVRRLLDHLHRKVRVALVHRLEESHLGSTSQVHILSTVSYQLHKTACHFTLSQENNFGRPRAHLAFLIYCLLSNG